jgi:hypothetical protein
LVHAVPGEERDCLVKRLALAVALAVFVPGCVGIIDNEGMGEDGGEHGTVTGGGSTTVTSGTTTSGDTTTGSTQTGSTSSGSTTDTTTSTAGSGSSTTSGAGGAGGAGGGGTGGSFGSSGTGGSSPDASQGGSGGSRPDGGIGGGTTDGGVVGPKFSQISSIVQRSCASCHRSFTAYATLTTHAVSRCGNDMLAKPNDPANSAFLELVLGQCGGYLMPRGCAKAPCIAQADIDTFTAWINAGAPSN